MKRRVYRTEYHVVAPKRTRLFEASPVLSFLGVETKESDGSVNYHNASDLSLLFQQKKLDSLGADTLKTFLDSLQLRSDPLRQLRTKCSDDELMACIKSRNVQSPSELLAWSSYLNKNISELKRLYKEMAEDKKKSKDNEPPKTD